MNAELDVVVTHQNGDLAKRLLQVAASAGLVANKGHAFLSANAQPIVVGENLSRNLSAEFLNLGWGV